MLFSVGHCALRMDDGINCPKCDRSDLSKRGYFGHMQMQHGVGSEEARALLEGEAPQKPGSSASADASEQAGASEPDEAGAQATAQDLLDADPDGDSDPLDEALAEWVHRRKQREAIRTLSEMDDRPDRPDRDGGADDGPLARLVEEVGADAIREAILDGDDDGMTEEDVRRAVRQEVDRTAVADGAGPVGDWKVQALSEGADPETVAELAAAESGGGLADAVGTLADKLAGSEAGEAIAGGVADAGADVVADALRAVASGRSEPQAPPEQYREYREADGGPAHGRQAQRDGHGPADAPEVATDAQRAPGADASGREVRRSEERLARVTDPDPDRDDYAVPSEYEGGDADES